MLNKVTVIIPVYNVEKYIDRCVMSVIKQTYKNLEVILVDDGSLDNSGVLCDEYKLKDDRIKVIHKKNGGLSDARNTGMKISTGDYLLFVDSDDYLQIDAIERLLELALKFDAEIVEGGAVSLTKEKKVSNFKSPNIMPEKIYNGVEYAIERIRNHCFYAAVWLKFYRRDYIEKLNIWFKKGRIHEDELWNPQTIIPAQRIVYTDYCFYNYDITRSTSIMNQYSEKNLISIFDNCRELSLFYKTSNLNRIQRNFFLNYVIKQYMISAIRTSDLSWYKKNRDIVFVLKNVKSIKLIFISIIYILNIKVFVKILKKKENMSI